MGRGIIKSDFEVEEDPTRITMITPHGKATNGEGGTIIPNKIIILD